MRFILLSLMLVGLGLSTPARADDRAEIERLEQAWGRAFLARDHATLDRIVAPEFKLFRASNWDRSRFTPRDRWMANAKGFVFHIFEVEVLDTLVIGDTAVATVKGRWKVDDSPVERFLLADTWVKRGGQWQVVSRHSTPFPEPEASPSR
jgi:ketosteroid isomerase-like protein